MKIHAYINKSSKWAAIFCLLASTMVQGNVNETHSMQYTNVEKIRLENIKMKIDVSTHNENDVKIDVIGPKDLHDLIQIKNQDSELVIRQLKSEYTVGDVSVITYSTGKNDSSRSVVTIGDKTTIVDGGGVVVAQSDKRPSMHMEIKVPAGTPLSLIDFSGKATIGDIRSSFYMQGSGKVTTGSLADVNLEIDKNAKVEIYEVENYLSVLATDNSKLRLKHGDIKEMQAELSGNSRVKYEGHANKGHFSITDNSKLYVTSVDQRSNSKISRNGRLTVGNW